MNKIRLYIYPVIFGFVIVPLLVWPTVIALAVLIFTLTFLAEIIFSFPLLVVRISLQELQLELLVEYALFFSVMGGIGWQFSRRTPPELKNRLHCWLILSARLVPSLVLRWDIIASGVAKIEAIGRSGAIG